MKESNGCETAVFVVPLPGGRVARVPLEVLERYVDAGAKTYHGAIEAEPDVTPHFLHIDAKTGASAWHTEWELGQCEYTDENGFPQTAYVWHRHPLGSEYTEIYDGTLK